MLTIKILGSGCARCERVEQMVKQVAEEMGLEATFQHVRDYSEITRLGVMVTPGLVIDGKVVCTGRVPAKAEVSTWLADAAS